MSVNECLELSQGSGISFFLPIYMYIHTLVQCDQINWVWGGGIESFFLQFSKLAGVLQMYFCIHQFCQTDFGHDF